MLNLNLMPGDVAKKRYSEEVPDDNWKPALKVDIFTPTYACLLDSFQVQTEASKFETSYGRYAWTMDFGGSDRLTLMGSTVVRAVHQEVREAGATMSGCRFQTIRSLRHPTHGL